jgi:DhnA family fructose-bisphosphate aldolase class Ia
MGEVGKHLRLKRIFKEDGKTLIVAMDHGLGSRPVPGLERPLKTIQKVAEGGADAILVSYGIIKRYFRELPRDIGLILSIPADPRHVELASRIGVHAVKTTFFGSLKDERLQLLHQVSIECTDRGIPFLAEIVPMNVEKGEVLYDVDSVKVAARMGAEFGADFIKTCYTGSEVTFREVVEVCPVPVVIMGGAKMDDDRSVLEIVRGAIDAGGAGVAFGRNIFQHRSPTTITRAIAKIIHEGASVEEALKELKS